MSVTKPLTIKKTSSDLTLSYGSEHEQPTMREQDFRRMLSRERKRSERSRKHLLLMLIDGKELSPSIRAALMEKTAASVSSGIRETDLLGWFESGSVLGVIFAELGDTPLNSAVKTIEGKVVANLQRTVKGTTLERLFISFYAYPDDWCGKKPGRSLDVALYPDLFEVEEKKKLSVGLKRLMDVAGSAVALTLLLPIFALLTILVKLTSKGPVFFRQSRVGRYGKPFVFLKFRSMIVSTDASIHQEYMKNFIAGRTKDSVRQGESSVIYKIQNDPRVTWVGRLMRRTSLDEIPQFWNVLKGEMSLVGPRPPIPYELDGYDIWHRRRLLEAKPGITGLWQVHGRSKTTFDEMVRLDLQYARTWSPFLDLKILLQTPRAVFSGDGAY